MIPDDVRRNDAERDKLLRLNAPVHPVGPALKPSLLASVIERLDAENKDLKIQNSAMRELLLGIAADIRNGDLKDPHGDATALLPDIKKATKA